jgi:hypothetical protein
MGKKQVAVSLRKPPPTDPDEFVAAAAASPPVASRRFGEEGPVVDGRTGQKRELTVYIPIDLARRLALQCAELDRDVSNFVADALSKALGSEDPSTVPLPLDAWSRVRALFAAARARLHGAVQLIRY